MNLQMAWPFFPENEIDWLTGEFKKILQGDAPLSMGQRVREFEEEFSEYIGVPYAVATNSCTAALEIALRSIEIGSGDEVIVPVETFIATGSAVVREGATPVFCDIDTETYCLNLQEIKKCVTKKTKAIIMVHMAGMIAPDALQIKEYCQQQNIVLIEDAAHAVGATINGIKAGGIGDIGCFSFYPTKIITTAEGGMLVCSDNQIYEKANAYRHRGRDMQSQNELYSRLGTNNRMTEFSALLGISQLRCLNDFLEVRQSIASIYNAFLGNSSVCEFAQPIKVPSNIEHAYWRYLVTLNDSIDREQVKMYLANAGIPSDWAYYPALHLQPYFKNKFNTKRGMCPVAENLLERNICLPINAMMQARDAEFVVEKFIEAVREQNA